MKYHPVVEISRASIEKMDLEVISRFLQSRKPQVCLEIGTWKGYSAEFWLELFRPEIFITIEKEPKMEDAVEMTRAGVHYLWGHDSRSIDTYKKVHGILNDRLVDFLFIDGDHSYDGVMDDWSNYSQLMAKGSVVIFHDCCYHSEGTEEADVFWNMIKKDKNYIEVKSTPTSTGIGIILL